MMLALPSCVRRLFVALALLFAAPFASAQAADFAAGSTCHAAAQADEDYARLARRSDRWICDPVDWSIASPRAILRFDLRGEGGEQPTTFQTHLTRFRHMRLTLIGADGRLASRDLDESGMSLRPDGWMMMTALPRLARPAVALVVTVDEARHPRLLSDARLTGTAEAGSVDLGFMLVIAGLCGLLLMPLLSNLAFYRALRQPFLLWYTLAVALMLVQTLVTSGLVTLVGHWTIAQLSWASAISFGGGIAAAACFAANLMEPGMLDPLHRRLLRATALWIAPWVLFYLMADGGLRPLAWMAYYLSFVPVLCLIGWAMAVAQSRGSRAVRYQIVAWGPFMATGIYRIVSALGLTNAPVEAELEQHLCLAWEALITALGVVERFLILRDQRDDARVEARAMGHLADHDSLTGMLNRRGLENRFATLWDEGYRSLALIDLDRFKGVNDVHGHLVGDAVLAATAQVLAPDADTVTARIGGEEFVLLMRGANVPLRAERRRQAIPTRLASAIPALDRLVTGSMGLVMAEDHEGPRPGFLELYQRADRLLYAAKEQGRNLCLTGGLDPQQAPRTINAVRPRREGVQPVRGRLVPPELSIRRRTA